MQALSGCRHFELKADGVGTTITAGHRACTICVTDFRQATVQQLCLGKSFTGTTARLPGSSFTPEPARGSRGRPGKRTSGSVHREGLRSSRERERERVHDRAPHTNMCCPANTQAYHSRPPQVRSGQSLVLRHMGMKGHSTVSLMWHRCEIMCEHFVPPNCWSLVPYGL